jgi:hypothetical protein
MPIEEAPIRGLFQYWEKGSLMRTLRFDKIAGSDFERAQHGPQGEGKDSPSNPSLSAIFYLRYKWLGPAFRRR